MISEEKKLFRLNLSRLPLSRGATENMHSLLMGLKEWQQAKSIFCYVSVEPEPDTRALLKAALSSGKQLAVPRVYGKGKMLAHSIDTLNCLVPGALGIPEPPNSAPVLQKPDLVIVPCLACDKLGYRLGHGGGYYDRYLTNVPCFSVCLCPDELVFDSIPHSEHDVKPDVIITQTRILSRKDEMR